MNNVPLESRAYPSHLPFVLCVKLKQKWQKGHGWRLLRFLPFLPNKQLNIQPEIFPTQAIAAVRSTLNGWLPSVFTNISTGEKTIRVLTDSVAVGDMLGLPDTQTPGRSALCPIPADYVGVRSVLRVAKTT